jgi:hypothetical protein
MEQKPDEIGVHVTTGHTMGRSKKSATMETVFDLCKEKVYSMRARRDWPCDASHQAAAGQRSMRQFLDGYHFIRA